MPSEKVDLTRMPPVTTALLLESTRLETFRESFGMIQCRERGVGVMRKKLGRIAPEPVGIGVTGEEAKFELAQDGARTFLAAICERCPFSNCKMKRW